MASNKDRRHSEAKEYFFCTHVTSDGLVWELLLTRGEVARARKRAGRNPEDTYDDYIVLQGRRGDPKPETQPGTIPARGPEDVDA